MTQGSYDYLFYGIRLRADRSLPGLNPQPPDQAADITVQLTERDGMRAMPISRSAWLRLASGVWKAPHATGTFFRMLWSGGGYEVEFVLDPGGDRVWVAWNERVNLEDVTALLVGPILGCLLRLRGHTLLHGSVVDWTGRGLVFLGPRGAGKSTTALACIQRGAELVSDDLVVLLENGSDFRAPFGQPALRMRPRSAEALCGSFESLRSIWSDTDLGHSKRYVDVPAERLPGDATSLHTIYVLGPRGTDRPGIHPVGVAEAISVLMAHRPNTFLDDREGQARDFSVLGRLAARVPVKLLTREEGLEGLGGIIDSVVADATINR